MRAFLLLIALVLLGACSELGVTAKSKSSGDSATVPGAGSISFDKPGVIAGSVRLPEFERVVLGNGVVLLMHVKKDVPIIHANVLVRGGALADQDGRSGTALLTAGLLEKGSGSRDARTFAEEVAFAGGAISAASDLEYMNISAQFLSRDEDLLIELLSDMLMRPHFDAKEFARLRDRQIELIKAAKESDPRVLINTYGEAFLFSDHPYGRPGSGDEATLARITLDDIKAFYSQHMGADRLIVTITGDFDPASLRQKISKTLGTWRNAAAPPPKVATTVANNTGRVLLIDKPDATQTYFWLGARGVDRRFEKRAVLNLVNTVFGGRFTSMLNTELRVKSGLTYGARSSFSMPEQPAALAITSFTQTDTTVQAIDLAIETLMRLHQEGIDADMADSARNYILGQFPTRLETGGQIATYLATLEYYGLDRDYIDEYANEIRAVSNDDIRALINSVYPKKEDLVMVLIGNADRIRNDVAKYGELVEMRIDVPGFGH